MIPRTPAAGTLEVGDRILTVGGRPAGELDTRALRRLACGADALDVRRDRDGVVRSLRIPTARIP